MFGSYMNPFGPTLTRWTLGVALAELEAEAATLEVDEADFEAEDELAPALDAPEV